MKNEDRIVELLAENLKNQDIQSEKLERVTQRLDYVGDKLDLLVDVVKDLSKVLQSQSSILERLVEKYDKIDDVEHRVFLLEKKLK